MNISYIFGVVTIVVLVIIIVSIFYFENTRKRESSSVYFEEIELQPCDFKDFHNPILKTLMDGKQKGYVLEDTKAIVIYGNVPSHKSYWGITAYKMNGTPKAYGDTVSNRKVQSMSCTNGIAVVLTGNPVLFNYIKRELTKEWKKNNGDRLVKVYPLYTDSTGSWNLVVKYMNELPNFGCRMYNFPGIKTKPIPKLRLIPKDCAPKEEDKISEKIWHKTALKSAKMKGHEIIREVKVSQSSDDRDWLKYTTDDINLADDESVLILAIDHVATDRSILSQILYETYEKVYGSFITGDVSNRIRNIGSNIRAHIILHNPGKKDKNCFSDVQKHEIIRFTELIGPETISGIAPGINSIVAMKVFIVRK